MKRSAAANIPTFSVIGGNVTINGNIDAQSDLHIDGQVNGDIRCIELVQGEASQIKGRIEASSIRLFGHVEGAIQTKAIIIEASARVTGDISYENISIAPGAQIDGQLTRHSDTNLKLVSGGTSE